METTAKTVKVSEATHTRLEKLGVKGESFDEIIVKLLDDKEALRTLLDLIKQAETAFETSKADFRDAFTRLVAAGKAR